MGELGESPKEEANVLPVEVTGPKPYTEFDGAVTPTTRELLNELEIAHLESRKVEKPRIEKFPTFGSKSTMRLKMSENIKNLLDNNYDSSLIPPKLQLSFEIDQMQLKNLFSGSVILIENEKNDDFAGDGELKGKQKLTNYRLKQGRKDAQDKYIREHFQKDGQTFSKEELSFIRKSLIGKLALKLNTEKAKEVEAKVKTEELIDPDHPDNDEVTENSPNNLGNAAEVVKDSRFVNDGQGSKGNILRPAIFSAAVPENPRKGRSLGGFQITQSANNNVAEGKGVPVEERKVKFVDGELIEAGPDEEGMTLTTHKGTGASDILDDSHAIPVVIGDTSATGNKNQLGVQESAVISYEPEQQIVGSLDDSGDFYEEEAEINNPFGIESQTLLASELSVSEESASEKNRRLRKEETEGGLAVEDEQALPNRFANTVNALFSNIVDKKELKYKESLVKKSVEFYFNPDSTNPEDYKMQIKFIKGNFNGIQEDEIESVRQAIIARVLGKAIGEADQEPAPDAGSSVASEQAQAGNTVFGNQPVSSGDKVEDTNQYIKPLVGKTDDIVFPVDRSKISSMWLEDDNNPNRQANSNFKRLLAEEPALSPFEDKTSEVELLRRRLGDATAEYEVQEPTHEEPKETRKAEVWVDAAGIPYGIELKTKNSQNPWHETTYLRLQEEGVSGVAKMVIEKGLKLEDLVGVDTDLMVQISDAYNTEKGKQEEEIRLKNMYAKGETEDSDAYMARMLKAANEEGFESVRTNMPVDRWWEFHDRFYGQSADFFMEVEPESPDVQEVLKAFVEDSVVSPNVPDQEDALGSENYSPWSNPHNDPKGRFPQRQRLVKSEKKESKAPKLILGGLAAGVALVVGTWFWGVTQSSNSEGLAVANNSNTATPHQQNLTDQQVNELRSTEVIIPTRESDIADDGDENVDPIIDPPNNGDDNNPIITATSDQQQPVIESSPTAETERGVTETLETLPTIVPTLEASATALASATPSPTMEVASITPIPTIEPTETPTTEPRATVDAQQAVINSVQDNAVLQQPTVTVQTDQSDNSTNLAAQSTDIPQVIATEAPLATEQDVMVSNNNLDILTQPVASTVDLFIDTTANPNLLAPSVHALGFVGFIGDSTVRVLGDDPDILARNNITWTNLIRMQNYSLTTQGHRITGNPVGNLGEIYTTDGNPGYDIASTTDSLFGSSFAGTIVAIGYGNSSSVDQGTGANTVYILEQDRSPEERIYIDGQEYQLVLAIGHGSSIVDGVSEGQNVNAGDPIGHPGSEGAMYDGVDNVHTDNQYWLVPITRNNGVRQLWRPSSIPLFDGANVFSMRSTAGAILIDGTPLHNAVEGAIIQDELSRGIFISPEQVNISEEYLVNLYSGDTFGSALLKWFSESEESPEIIRTLDNTTQRFLRDYAVYNYNLNSEVDTNGNQLNEANMANQLNSGLNLILKYGNNNSVNFLQAESLTPEQEAIWDVIAGREDMSSLSSLDSNFNIASQTVNSNGEAYLIYDSVNFSSDIGLLLGRLDVNAINNIRLNIVQGILNGDIDYSSVSSIVSAEQFNLLSSADPSLRATAFSNLSQGLSITFAENEDFSGAFNSIVYNTGDTEKLTSILEDLYGRNGNAIAITANGDVMVTALDSIQVDAEDVVPAVNSGEESSVDSSNDQASANQEHDYDILTEEEIGRYVFPVNIDLNLDIPSFVTNNNYWGGDYEPFYIAAGNEFGIEPEILRSISFHETGDTASQMGDRDSNGNYRSFGMFQIQAGIWGRPLLEWGVFDGTRTIEEELLDPESSPRAAAAIINHLKSIHWDPELSEAENYIIILAHYNGGNEPKRISYAFAREEIWGAYYLQAIANR